MATYVRGLLDPWALAFKAGRKRIYWVLLGRRILCASAAIVALTEHERELLENMRVSKRIEQIPNGVSVSEFATAPSRTELEERFPALGKRRFVLFLGRIHQKKGIDLLFHALGRLGYDAQSLAVVIAGPVDTGYRTTFERLLSDYSRREQIILTGPVSGPDKAALLRHADVFTLPSYSEGLPVAVLEALASGCPVVITRQCNLPEVGRARAGIEIEPRADELSKAIATLLSTDDLRRDMADRARRLAEDRFDWRSVGLRMLALCQSIHETHRRVT